MDNRSRALGKGGSAGLDLFCEFAPWFEFVDFCGGWDVGGEGLGKVADGRGGVGKPQKMC